MNEMKLKPCPFCGETVAEVKGDDRGDGDAE